MEEAQKFGIGKHAIIEYYECDQNLINDVVYLEEVLNKAAQKAQASILSSHFHTFNPQGVSGVVVIAESHFSIHTWPEHGYAAVDFFTCSADMNMRKAHIYLQEALKSQRQDYKVLDRGAHLSNKSIQEANEIQDL